MFRSLATYDANASRVAKFKRFGALINVVQLLVDIPHTQWSPYYLVPQTSTHDSTSGALVVYQPFVRWNISRLRPAASEVLADSGEPIHVAEEQARTALSRTRPINTAQAKVKKANRLLAKDRLLRDLGVNNQKSETPKIPPLKAIPAVSKTIHSYLRKGAGARPAKGAENVRTASGNAPKPTIKGKDKDTKAQEIGTKKNNTKGLKSSGIPTTVTTDQAAAGFAARRRRRAAATTK